MTEVADLGARLRYVCDAARARIYGHAMGASRRLTTSEGAA
jgi:hypothetical protein